MTHHAADWPQSSLFLSCASTDARLIAPEVYQRACRVDFEAPGFCLVDLEVDVDSSDFRRFMVDLKRAITAVHEENAKKNLSVVSAGRFDQQQTTRLHLDAGPDECLLMLGYEPSAIDSELEIADFSKCAFDYGLTAPEFMARHNPMFTSEQEMLKSYTFPVTRFSRTRYQIAVINNSCAQHSRYQPAWQGVLHRAIVPYPDDSLSRTVNSMMIASTPIGSLDEISSEMLDDFVSTSVVLESGYSTSVGKQGSANTS